MHHSGHGGQRVAGRRHASTGAPGNILPRERGLRRRPGVGARVPPQRGRAARFQWRLQLHLGRGDRSSRARHLHSLLLQLRDVGRMHEPFGLLDASGQPPRRHEPGVSVQHAPGGQSAQVQRQVVRRRLGVLCARLTRGGDGHRVVPAKGWNRQSRAGGAIALRGEAELHHHRSGQGEGDARGRAGHARADVGSRRVRSHVDKAEELRSDAGVAGRHGHARLSQRQAEAEVRDRDVARWRRRVRRRGGRLGRRCRERWRVVAPPDLAGQQLARVHRGRYGAKGGSARTTKSEEGTQKFAASRRSCRSSAATAKTPVHELPPLRSCHGVAGCRRLRAASTTRRLHRGRGRLMLWQRCLTHSSALGLMSCCCF
mmetsp:Transcript_51440/g.144490  ORF Transcript_51440/g.144490 Transcript_51440/m.144490 type:complete len:371 (-) Transcript_51440:3-1115(-)